MSTICILEKSDKPEKKFMVTVKKDPQDRGKKVYFGATGYSDYPTHKDEHRMELYTIRHQRKENWKKSGITTAGFWSKWLLWNKPTISASISDIRNRFGVKIIKLNF